MPTTTNKIITIFNVFELLSIPLQCLLYKIPPAVTSCARAWQNRKQVTCFLFVRASDKSQLTFTICSPYFCRQNSDPFRFNYSRGRNEAADRPRTARNFAHFPVKREQCTQLMPRGRIQRRPVKVSLDSATHADCFIMTERMCGFWLI